MLRCSNRDTDFVRDPVIACCNVRCADSADLDALVPLFDGYRQFYQQASDLALARQFLGDRLRLQQSVIFLAKLKASPSTALGFVQMFPLFSSTRAARTWLLNDLYVAPTARAQGVAQILMEFAARWAKDDGAIALSLSTAHDNISAQRLYEKLGWTRDLEYREYTLRL